MNKSLIFCDRLMYGALLGMIWFLPYGRALIEACLMTMLIAWVAKHFLQFQKIPSSGMGLPLIAIGLLIVLTIPWSHDPSLGLKKLFSRYLQQIFIMYGVAEIIQNRKRLYITLTTLMLMVFFVSATALMQYLVGHNSTNHASVFLGRVSGPMHHPNDLGTLLATVLPVVFTMIITCQTWIPFLRGQPKTDQGKPWAGIVVISVLFLFMAIALGLTDSRGAWVAFAVSMIALGIFLKRPKFTVLIVLMLVVFFWLFDLYCLNTRGDLYDASAVQGPVVKSSWTNLGGLLAHYNALKLFSCSSGRNFYWQTAVDVIKHYPWFGCGYNAYVQTLRDLNVGHEEYPHNSILHITAELGFVGLFLYSWLFFALCLQIKKILRVVSHERDLFLLGCGISCGILAWMVHSLTDTPWSSLQLGILLWVMIGILLSLGLVGGSKERNS